MWRSKMSSLLLALILESAVIFSSGANLPEDYARPLRPQAEEIENEDAAFWRDYGRNDLNRMIRLTSRPNNNHAKNVIIFVGDGMGIQTGTMARIYKGQKMGKSGEESVLEWEKFPSTGMSKTYNTDYQVPDSAGTATALFSGVKTRLAMLGLDTKAQWNSCDPDTIEKSKIKSMLHWAVDAGMQTGIVSTARITHATPAALYCHSTNRDWETITQVPEDKRECQDIAKQLIYSDVGRKVNVIFGGGLRNFKLSSEGGTRTDEDLTKKYMDFKRLDGREGTVIYNSSNLQYWDQGNTDHVLGLFSPSHIPYEADRSELPDPTGADPPSLSQMTQSAVNRLAGRKGGDKGFFLMVEGARIDHGHHENNAHKALDEALEMEKALKETMENPKINLDETLIIVTADHSHSVTFNGYPKRGNSIFGYVFEPARKLSQKYSSSDPLDHAYSSISYANGPGFFHHYLKDSRGSQSPWKDVRKEDFMSVNYKQPAMTPGPQGYETHGGEDVGIFATGPQAHLLTGVHEQSYIADVMAYSACVGEYQLECQREKLYPSSAAVHATMPAITMAAILTALLLEL